MRSYFLYAVSSRRLLFLTLNDSEGTKKKNHSWLVFFFFWFVSRHNDRGFVFLPRSRHERCCFWFCGWWEKSISLLNILVNKHTRKHRDTKENESQRHIKKQNKKNPASIKTCRQDWVDDIRYARNMSFWFRTLPLFAIICFPWRLISHQIIVWCKYQHGRLSVCFFSCPPRTFVISGGSVETTAGARGHSLFAFCSGPVWSVGAILRKVIVTSGSADSPMSCAGGCRIYTMHSNLRHQSPQCAGGL